MRLNRSLGMLFLLLTPVILSASSARQLTDVGVASKDNATTLTIRANGSFQHTEYRPTDNLLLVDLAGVSAAKLENHGQDFHGKFPGVSSYHVVGYKGANGSSITRVEMGLAPDAIVSVRESSNTLALRVTSNAVAAVAAEPATDDTKAAAPTPAATKVAANGRPVHVRNVTMARGKNGFNVEIDATGAVSPKVMKLTAPDRIVIDIPNAIPATKREIAVNNADIRSIRMALYSLNPPATRVVVDLKSAQDYEIANVGNRLTLKLHGAAMASAAPAPVPVKQEAKVEAAATSPASPNPVAQVQFMAATASAPQIETAAPASATDRAAQAAAHFSTPTTEIPISNSNASIKPQPAINLAAMQQNTPAPAAAPAAQFGSCGSNKYNGEPISVNLKDVDLRDFFRLVHDISGLNVVLDPQVKGSLTMVLDDVPWDQALQIVLKNNQLDCELQGNVLRIATTATLKKEADDRKAQIDAQANAVDLTTINRYLSYAVAKDEVPTIKAFLSARGSIIADERTNSLIISDIPSVVPAVDRLIHELDRKTQEVEIEARVVAANRSFARDIGTQLGFGWANTAANLSLGGASNASPTLAPPIPGIVQVGTPAVAPPFPPVAIPLFSDLGAINPTSGFNFLLEHSRYRVDATLTMAESRGLIKILSRPRVVTQNNIPAVVKQGVRIPVVTLAQLGGPPTVTYVDAYLRLSVKPQITNEGTIFLNVDVENTVPNRANAIQGNPELDTEQATTQVLVSDGGTVVIGGVIQTNNNVGISQVPLLGNIPVLGNLFKRRTVSTSVQELIFFITPKIVQT